MSAACLYRQQEEAHKQEEEAKKTRERSKDGQRKSAYLEAQRRQAQRVSSILSKSATKQQKLDTLKSHQDHENARRALERRLDLDLKWEKVKIHECHSANLPQDASKSSHEAIQLITRLSQDCALMMGLTD